MAKKSRRGESVQEIYTDLFKRLIRGDLKPGDRIREADITRSFETSRTPVREAIKRLEMEGVLARDAVGGLSVLKLDHAMIAELYVMREVLESTAAQLASKNATPPKVLSLEKILEKHRESLDDPKKASINNRIFHSTIYAMANNQYLIRAMGAMSGPVALLAPSSMHDETRAKQTVEEHEQIYEAIAKGDPAAAGEAAKRHVQNSYRARLGDMFEQLYDDDLFIDPLTLRS